MMVQYIGKAKVKSTSAMELDALCMRRRVIQANDVQEWLCSD